MLYQPQKYLRKDRNKWIAKGLAHLEVRDAFEFLTELAPGTVDLIVSSPPYCMGKEYDTSASVDDFIASVRWIPIF